MKTYLIISLSVMVLYCTAQQLPPGVKTTPVKKIKLVAVKLIVPEQFKGKVRDDRVLNIPEGYTAKVFYAGRLDKPRFFAWGPDSVLYVANKNSGEILALPDRKYPPLCR